jgi:hypothetical protein
MTNEFLEQKLDFLDNDAKKISHRLKVIFMLHGRI